MYIYVFIAYAVWNSKFVRLGEMNYCKLYRSIEDLIKDYISFVFTHDLRRFCNDIVCEFGHV